MNYLGEEREMDWNEKVLERSAAKNIIICFSMLRHSSVDKRSTRRWHLCWKRGYRRIQRFNPRYGRKSNDQSEAVVKLQGSIH